VQRAVSLSNPKVIEKIHDNFVPCWSNSMNGGPAQQWQASFDQQLATYENSTYGSVFRHFPNGTGDTNIVMFFCTAEGQVLHALKGYWEPERLIEEIDFVTGLRDTLLKQKLPEEELKLKLADAHRERAQALRKLPKEASRPQEPRAIPSTCPSSNLQKKKEEQAEQAAKAQAFTPQTWDLLAQGHETQAKAPLQEVLKAADEWNPMKQYGGR